jgi:hypothetical protein
MQIRILLFYCFIILQSCADSKRRNKHYNLKIDSIYNASHDLPIIDSLVNPIDSIMIDSVKIFRYWHKNGKLQAIGTYYTSSIADTIVTFNPENFEEVKSLNNKFKWGKWLYYDNKGILIKKFEYKQEDRIPVSSYHDN